MFSRHRTKGFVINKKEKGELDRIITFYTEDFGKIKILGKSIRKGSSKLKSFSEPFSLIELEFIEGRSIKTLTDVKKSCSYLGILKDLEKISLSEKVGEDINELINGEEKDVKVWFLLKDFFESINSSKKPLNEYYYFIWNIFSALGYKPELYFCLKCQKNKFNSQKINFSLIDGGLVCDECNKLNSFFSVPEETIKTIRVAVSKDKDLFKKISISNENKKSLWDITEKYISFIKQKNN